MAPKSPSKMLKPFGLLGSMTPTPTRVMFSPRRDRGTYVIMARHRVERRACCYPQLYQPGSHPGPTTASAGAEHAAPAIGQGDVSSHPARAISNIRLASRRSLGLDKFGLG